MRIVHEGYPYIVTPALLAVVALVFGYWPVALIFLLVSAFMAYFFRDPQREVPQETGIVVSPADGRVTRVEAVAPENAASPTLVSIFLSPLDVHINRAPIAGTIRDVSYARGKFLMATNEKASLLNEQNVLTIEGENLTVVCKQIAGILARRIVCWKHRGEQVSRGEKFGLIKFSSRTDVLLPANIQVVVSEGARVLGGTTIIGRTK